MAHESRGFCTTPTKATHLQRNWGEEVIFADEPTYHGKCLRRKAGTKGGYQWHVKRESHYLIEGFLAVRTDTGEKLMRPGDCWTVEPMVAHQEEAITDCLVVEVSDPTDEDRYGLEPDPGDLPSMSKSEALDKLGELARTFRARAVDCDHLATTILQEWLD